MSVREGCSRGITPVRPCVAGNLSLYMWDQTPGNVHAQSKPARFRVRGVRALA
jgi:hypothetical protein